MAVSSQGAVPMRGLAKSALDTNACIAGSVKGPRLAPALILANKRFGNQTQNQGARVAFQ